jgi:hypothetical protein
MEHGKPQKDLEVDGVSLLDLACWEGGMERVWSSEIAVDLTFLVQEKGNIEEHVALIVFSYETLLPAVYCFTVCSGPSYML